MKDIEPWVEGEDEDLAGPAGGDGGDEGREHLGLDLTSGSDLSLEHFLSLLCCSCNSVK